MSLQAQPQQQPQQPVQVYPTSVTNQPSSHHSKGSFGTVFIVLAIILVISVIACVLGRLCNRRYNNKHNHNHNMRPVKQQRPQIHNFHPRDQGDIEFGVDRRIPTTSRPNGHGGHGEGIGPQQPPPNGNNMRGFEMKHGHEEELRAGA